MNVDKVLNRIGYSGSLEVSPELLEGLQKAFLFSVPFENLDIHAQIPITLDPDRFYQKIVEQRRGGFCYECNTLFYQLLLHLGFDVHMVAARMVLGDINSTRYSHLALVVNLDQTWLADVGNGQSLHAPMPIPSGDLITTAENIDYRIGPFKDGEYALYFRKPGADWLPRFGFSMTPRQLNDFEAMCRFHQTSPESLFMKQRLCTLPTERGRILLAGNTFTVTEDGRETEVILANDDEIDTYLKKYFGYGLPSYR